MNKLLVTGGAGYIGSHTVLALLEAGWQVVVLDNFSNASEESLRRVETITGKRIEVIRGDVRDGALLRSVFAAHEIAAVIHFAGLKAVGESVAQPLRYYDCNVGGSLRLMETMQEAAVRTLIFSSSATVYGLPHTVPITEDFPLQVTNPYGASKLHVEQMMRDLHQAEPGWRIALLRYFNPVGSHPSGLIGEDPTGEPTNLMPYIAQVAVGRREALRVFGGDYPTPDGTGVRDFIHVMDLARGHLAALDYLAAHEGLVTTNLGTGKGYSVLEMVAAFEQASGRKVPYEIVARRPGDIACCYADASLAQQLFGWRAEYGLAEMCADHWRWQLENPQGYRL